MKVKICFYAKLCTQNKILASKMQYFKQQTTSAFAPLILKRWIVSHKDVSFLRFSRTFQHIFRAFDHFFKLIVYLYVTHGTTLYCANLSLYEIINDFSTFLSTFSYLLCYLIFCSYLKRTGCITLKLKLMSVSYAVKVSF